MAFVRANSYRVASRGVNDVHRIVFHTAEIQEHRDSAEDVASYFSNPTTKVSAHACVDNDTLITCVWDKDVAFHAFGDNNNTLGLEMSGYAKQTAAQWNDAYSKAMLNRAAKWVADKATKYSIPVRWLTPAQERALAKGFVTHKIVSDVWGDGIRSDPGPNFPYEAFLKLVKENMAPPPPPPPPPPPEFSVWEVQYRDKKGEWAYAKDVKRPAIWAARHPGAFKRGAVYYRPRREDG